MCKKISQQLFTSLKSVKPIVLMQMKAMIFVEWLWAGIESRIFKKIPKRALGLWYIHMTQLITHIQYLTKSYFLGNYVKSLLAYCRGQLGVEGYIYHYLLFFKCVVIKITVFY